VQLARVWPAAGKKFFRHKFGKFGKSGKKKEENRSFSGKKKYYF
jgi:hypothetical protein